MEVDNCLCSDGGLLADGGPAPAHHLDDADGAAAAAGGHVHRYSITTTYCLVSGDNPQERSPSTISTPPTTCSSGASSWPSPWSTVVSTTGGFNFPCLNSVNSQV